MMAGQPDGSSSFRPVCLSGRAQWKWSSPSGSLEMRKDQVRGKLGIVDTYLSYEEIAQAFVDHLAERGLDGMSYGDFWRVLQEKGQTVRGRNRKVQKDFVYRALTLDDRLQKVRPGFFAPADA